MIQPTFIGFTILSWFTFYGIDYTGDDNISSDDTKHYLEGFLEGDWKIDPYWDEPEGKEH